MDTLDQDERIRSLEQFANTAPGGNGANLPATASAAAIAATGERVFGAQPLKIRRDEEQILKRLRVMAAAAGEAFYYRIPVRKKVKDKETGKEEWVTSYIEGPTIKCANAVSRLFGNCDTDLRVMDAGTHWIIYARFIDLETGYSLVRPFQQRKGQQSVRGDSARQEDIAFQIGVSKAIRNVTCNALELFTSFAAEEAKHSIIEKVGKRLDHYRERVVERLQEMDISLTRVERVRGRALKDWLATDVAKTIAEMQGIGDGMATVDETYPVHEVETVDHDTGEVLDKFAAANETAASDQTEATEETQQRSGSPSTAAAAGVEAQESTAPAASTPTTSDEYHAYAIAWIAEAANPEECSARWSREKSMRNKANVSPEVRDELEALKKSKVTELKRT